MKIECYISTRCTSEDLFRRNVKEALEREEADADVHVRRLDDEKAAAMGLRGSPSVFINGRELQPLATGGFA